VPHIEIFVPGHPEPKPQKYTKGSHPQWRWRENLGLMVKVHRTPEWPLRVPVALGMQFYVRVRGERRPPDFKNLWACAEDALKGILYVDDYLVDRVICPSGRTVIEFGAHIDGQIEGVALVIEWGEV